MDSRPTLLYWLLLVSCVLFGSFSGCGGPPPSPITPPPSPIMPTEQPRVVGVNVIGSGTATVIGGTVQFYAVAHMSDGAMRPKPTATWRSSDETVATITPEGLATGRRAGRADIQGTLEGQTGSTGLTVTAPVAGQP